MSNNAYPSINGIYLKNINIVEDYNGVKHISGDLYFSHPDNIDDKCVGYYNPVYQLNDNTQPEFFLRIDDEYKFLYDSESKYESMFNKNFVPLSEYDCPVGLSVLLSDLEIITYLYEFMVNICPNADFETIGLTGIINGHEETPMIKIIQIKDPTLTSHDQILDFINQKVDSIKLDKSYPTLLFKCIDDFVFFRLNDQFLEVATNDV